MLKIKFNDYEKNWLECLKEIGNVMTVYGALVVVVYFIQVEKSIDIEFIKTFVSMNLVILGTAAVVWIMFYSVIIFIAFLRASN